MQGLVFWWEAKMQALALDIGEVRVGIAASDISGTIAHPVCVLSADEVFGTAASFKRVLTDYEPEILVCGLPKTMRDEMGPQAQKVVAQARALAKDLGLLCTFVDERLSSREAKRILREQGLNEKQMRGKVDMVAASLFLQVWLDEQKHKA